VAWDGIGEFRRPNVGIVPIGDLFTMRARSPAFTCKKFFKLEMVLPCHYRTFPGMLDLDGGKFVAEMKDHNVVVPKVGWTLLE
jgi:L-ascorbate metabolism protein UlaG (beta-lactamase superfamily)